MHLAELLLNILGVLGDFVLTAIVDNLFSEETRGREVALWFGLFLSIEAAALAFSSIILAVAGVTLPFAIVWLIHRQCEKYGDLGDRFDLRQSLFYLALLGVLFACALDQGVGAVVQYQGGQIWPREAIILGQSAQIAVAAAFPIGLLLMWYLPNRIAAIGAGLIAGGAISQIADQALFEHMIAYARLPDGLHFNAADATIALGALALLAGQSLPAAKRESVSGLRQV